MSWEQPLARLSEAAALLWHPTLPACCQSSSTDSRVTPGHELTGAVVFLPCDASSLLLNPVKQESTGGRHEGPQEGVWAETRQLLAPRAPPRLERTPLGTGTGTRQRREAPADGNYDFRKLECCLGNINAHLSMGGTLGAGGWGVCTAHTCSHTNIYTYVCTRMQTHSGTLTCMHTHPRSHTRTDIHVHTHVYRHTCACTQVHTNTCVCMHTYIPAKPLTHQP